MIIETLPSGPLAVNCYLVACEETRQAAVIDPAGDAERILELIGQHQLQLRWILNTHGHFDHIGANGALKEATGAELMIHPADRPLLQQAGEHAAVFGLQADNSPPPDRDLQDGDELKLGALTIRVIHTPGHSPGGVCLHCQDHLFVGDTLFNGSVGRTDLPGGDHQSLIRHIRERLLCLAGATRVYPGHGPSTTIGREKKTNPFLQ